MQHVNLVLPHERPSAYVARRALVQLLAHECAETIDTSVLLTSELVTNAIEHTPGDIQFCVQFDPGRLLRVNVTDECVELPRVTIVDPTVQGGRGLFLIEEMATRWGSCPRPGGKTVWFELALKMPPRYDASSP